MGDEQVTLERLKALMPKWEAYLVEGGSPEPGTERYVSLMTAFWYTEGAIEGLKHAKEIYSK